LAGFVTRGRDEPVLGHIHGSASPELANFSKNENFSVRGKQKLTDESKASVAVEGQLVSRDLSVS